MTYRIGSCTSLIIDINRACNFRCPGCARDGIDAVPSHEKELRVPILAQIMEQIKTHDLTNQELYPGRAVNNIRFAGNGEPTLHPKLKEMTQFMLDSINGLDCYFWILTNLHTFPSGDYNEKAIENYYQTHYGFSSPKDNPQFILRPSVDLNHEIAYIIYKQSQGIDEATAFREYRQILANLFRHAEEHKYLDQVAVGSVSEISKLEKAEEFNRKRYIIPAKIPVYILGLSIYASDQEMLHDAKRLTPYDRGTPSGKESCYFVEMEKGKAVVYTNIANKGYRTNAQPLDQLSTAIMQDDLQYSEEVQRFFIIQNELRNIVTSIPNCTFDQQIEYVENYVIRYQGLAFDNKPGTPMHEEYKAMFAHWTTILCALRYRDILTTSDETPEEKLLHYYSFYKLFLKTPVHIGDGHHLES